MNIAPQRTLVLATASEYFVSRSATPSRCADVPRDQSLDAGLSGVLIAMNSPAEQWSDAINQRSIEMPAAPHIVETYRLIEKMIDRVGIAIEDSSPTVKRLVAREIINIYSVLSNSVQSDRDIPRLKLFLSDLERDLTTFSDDRCDDVGDGPGPYSIEGIAFNVLVHLVRLEECATYGGWTPEQLRDLGFDVRRDEEIIWLDAELVEVRDSSGSVRRRYRCQ